MKRAKQRPYYQGMYGSPGPFYILMMHPNAEAELRGHLPKGWPKGLPKFHGELVQIDSMPTRAMLGFLDKKD